jgi:hypothetical protein
MLISDGLGGVICDLFHSGNSILLLLDFCVLQSRFIDSALDLRKVSLVLSCSPEIFFIWLQSYYLKDFLNRSFMIFVNMHAYMISLFPGTQILFWESVNSKQIWISIKQSSS